tara:strand:+ start:1 stop:3627 length:3627 start_codon:yes stop_codon:yes gene_type:complete
MRGIGRYSLEIIKNIIDNGNENDYVLVANGALRDLRNEFKYQLNMKNVYYFEWFSPCPLDFYTDNNLRRQFAILLRSFAFSAIHVDLILITSFFEGYLDNCLVDIDSQICNSMQVSIFYDLIPLLKSKEYLDHNPKFSKFYNSKIKKLLNLDGYMAISNSSANELIDNLDLDPTKIVNISSACDQKVFNSEFNHKINDSILNKINGEYLLYTGAHDPRKNIKSLIHAYSLIDKNLRKNYKLVFAGKILESESNLLDTWIKQFNIDDTQIVKTGFISDEELSLLYKNCSLFIFPSLHEGFGLPVLEAMSCGAPVIGSNCTSVREVLSDDDVMFDPYDVFSIAGLIERSLIDKDFKKTLLQNAKIQSKRFSWKKSALKALEFFKITYNKSYKYNKHCISWSEILSENKTIFDLLFKKLISIKVKDLEKENFIYEELAASLDKINIQSSQINRVLYKIDKIKNWKLEGPLDSSYSLAILNRYFAENLDKYIDKLSLKVTEGPGDYQPNINYLKRYPIIFGIYENSNINKDYFDVVSRNMFPPRVTDMDGIFNIFHSYGWEESEFPYDWVEDFNSSLQGITVMSSLVKKILIDNGVNIPIKVTGLGLDHIDKIEVDASFKINAKKYKLLHVSSCFPRKGIDILIEAYSRIFTKNDDVCLIIKTFSNPHNNIQEIISNYRQNNELFPDVIVINDDLTDEQLKSLYLQADVLVAPSRGEGFGLPIGEAMCLGLPVITTGWGGQMDFCNKSNCWLVDYKFTLSSSHFNSINSYWVEPSIDDLAHQIYSVYNCSHDDVRKKTDSAKRQIKHLTWQNTVIKNIQFVEDDIKSNINKTNKRKSFKLACITPFNSKCGIASYSKYLLTNTVEEVVFFSPYNENNSDEKVSSFCSIPSWEIDSEEEDFLYLKEKIKALEITSIIVQFNYGLFNFKQLAILISDLKNAGIKIYFILHSTSDPGNNSKSISNLSKSFELCDRVFVHTIKDLNHLKDLGLNRNISLFHHGFLDFKPISSNLFTGLIKYLRKYCSYRIASYGFCLPNKGFKELIMACKILLNKGYNIKLTLYSAVYNKDYIWVLEQLKSLIIELDLQENVFIDPKYMEDSQTLKSLSKMDFLVFPYQNTGESSSASVRHGIASNQNVLVTPSPIFDDVSQLVNYLPGFTAEKIAEGIEQWLLKYKYKSKKENDKYLKRKQIISERSFSNLSYRLISMIKRLEMN